MIYEHLHISDMKRLMRINKDRLRSLREVRDNMTNAEYESMISRANERIKNELNIRR